MKKTDYKWLYVWLLAYVPRQIYIILTGSYFLLNPEKDLGALGYALNIVGKHFPDMMNFFSYDGHVGYFPLELMILYVKSPLIYYTIMRIFDALLLSGIALIAFYILERFTDTNKNNWLKILISAAMSYAVTNTASLSNDNVIAIVIWAMVFVFIKVMVGPVRKSRKLFWSVAFIVLYLYGALLYPAFIGMSLLIIVPFWIYNRRYKRWFFDGSILFFGFVYGITELLYDIPNAIETCYKRDVSNLVDGNWTENADYISLVKSFKERYSDLTLLGKGEIFLLLLIACGLFYFLRKRFNLMEFKNLPLVKFEREGIIEENQEIEMVDSPDQVMALEFVAATFGIFSIFVIGHPAAFVNSLMVTVLCLVILFYKKNENYRETIKKFAKPAVALSLVFCALNFAMPAMSTYASIDKEKNKEYSIAFKNIKYLSKGATVYLDRTSGYDEKELLYMRYMLSDQTVYYGLPSTDQLTQGAANNTQIVIISDEETMSQRDDLRYCCAAAEQISANYYIYYNIVPSEESNQ